MRHGCNARLNYTKNNLHWLAGFDEIDPIGLEVCLKLYLLVHVAFGGEEKMAFANKPV